MRDDFPKPNLGPAATQPNAAGMINMLARAVEQTFTQIASVGRIRVTVANYNPYLVANLPPRSVPGDVAYASDGRKNGEGAGAGTGVLAFFDGTNWIACDSGQTVVD